MESWSSTMRRVIMVLISLPRSFIEVIVKMWFWRHTASKRNGFIERKSSVDGERIGDKDKRIEKQ